MEALLKAAEVSTLMGLSLRHVQRLTKSGKFPYQVHTNAQNRPEYLIPLSALPEQAQKKYIEQHRPAAPAAPTKRGGKKPTSDTARTLESYSADERAEISYWMAMVDRWQQYRRKAGGHKAECDEKFVLLRQLEEPGRQISVETLYRKWAAIRAGDLDALVDKRGKARKGKTVLLPEIEQEFLSLYLDEAQLPIPRCVALTEQWARDNMPTALPLPSYHTFYRKAKAVPYAVTVLCREGEKAYYDKCSPYIRREYESIAANDYWIGDTHTLDVESMGPDGTLHRLYLSAWLDARSGIFTGWYVTASPGSQATLNALRKGITTRGIPLNVYVDNGREFLTADFGGRGHRAKKRLADGSEPFAPPAISMSWPFGKKAGNRKHSKIDSLPPEMKATVEEMILDGSATYSEIVEYLQEQGYSLSVSSVCRYAQGYVENMQTLQIAQRNFRDMMEELDRYPDLDTTEALVRIASQNLMSALASKKDEDWSKVGVDKLMNQISGLTRAVAYKKRVELQNKTDLEAGADDIKTALWTAMAKERPDLYRQVSAYLDRKTQESGT